MNTKTKNRPVKMNRNFEIKKSTQAAKLETLRRKTIRSEKYNGGAK